MAVRRNAWSPDTCSCCIEFKFTDPTDETTFSLTKVIRRCPAHLAVPDGELWVTLLDENRRKNLVHKQLVDEFGIAPDGSDFTWRYDDKRELHVTPPAKAAGRKDDVQSWCNGRFGTNKVKVE